MRLYHFFRADILVYFVIYELKLAYILERGYIRRNIDYLVWPDRC
jgi:hypothetical protein